MNKERRFIPMRLDDAPITGSLAQFLCIDWLPDCREREYPKLLKACRHPAATAGLTPAQLSLQAAILSLGHTGSVSSVAWSAEGRRALSGAINGVMKVWNIRIDQTEGGFQEASSSGKDTQKAPNQVQYTNAKVLLVGESGATPKPRAIRRQKAPAPICCSSTTGRET